MKFWILGIVAVFVAGVVFVAAQQTETAPIKDVNELSFAMTLSEGETLYKQYCAACHGANLEGQENWRTSNEDGVMPAPPHDETGHTWHHGDELLFAYTKLGGRALMAEKGMEFDSGMPGFGDVLADPEINAILDYIKSTWPERIQDIQTQRSAAE